MTDYSKTYSEQADMGLERTLRPSNSTEPMTEGRAVEMEQSEIRTSVARMTHCPKCGAEIDADADYCEACHSYIRRDVCSFCGAYMDEGAAFCPECGNSRDGIVCPDCHTINDFSFCRQCGRALTDEAKRLQAELGINPEYIRMKELAVELSELDHVLPYVSERDRMKEEKTEQLRARVLRLLAEDRGDVVRGVTEDRQSRRMTEAELKKRRAAAMARLQEALGQLSQEPVKSAVKARNYVMASKPNGVRVAWKCNYKNAMHSSPCGCAKPQLGGKWIVLGHGSAGHIKDEK